MKNVNLLDCTLRDGGYINDWNFGYHAIISIIEKLGQTGIEIIEVGFIKGNDYNPDKTLFPDTDCCKRVLINKNPKVQYVGMLDMSAPVPFERIKPRTKDSIDGIRVIFKKNRMNEAYEYCQYIKKQGYSLYVNFVSTDAYTDKEFIEGIEKFNTLKPYGVSIVDTFGLLKKRQLTHLVSIADNNLDKDIKLCYHAHNNLQQAFGNAEAMVEMLTKRDIVIDACVFGMGRGAGNLNLELFAEYMNENYGKNYLISPMLEVMDEHLQPFYKDKFWGYSLPLYLSASYGCHPNYAIYLAEKNTLSEKAFSELLQGISNEDKQVFSKDKADFYYKKYMNNFIDDKSDRYLLLNDLQNKRILLITPGKSLMDHYERVLNYIDDNTVIICVNFIDASLNPQYVFTSNERRFKEIKKIDGTKLIITSNIKDSIKADYIVNYSSCVGKEGVVFDNAGLMALRLLHSVGVRKVFVAGMDGYGDKEPNYYKNGFESRHHDDYKIRNQEMSKELKEIKKFIDIEFITPTKYEV